ncbi:Uncharacterised protein [Yersinia pekkanenii]|uniref:Uncharacterized protein n=1 Tax=Yersinia pekkanenii TaxID=1288385 RepID=A0A0T9QJK9_9GAMM|nr:Uncharacterised protein [Yersinia pekkanenii]CRY68329.1 Uncharacterised protein [Yersinia pekkanenii]
MANIILSDTSASVSELKKNPMATVKADAGYPEQKPACVLLYSRRTL